MKPNTRVPIVPARWHERPCDACAWRDGWRAGRGGEDLRVGNLPSRGAMAYIKGWEAGWEARHGRT